MVVPALNPTGYTGLNERSPRDSFTRRRAPTPRDFENYDVGDRWIDLAASQAYILVNKAGGVATWQLFGLAATAIDQFTVDLGVPVGGVAGNLDLIGDPTYGLRTSNGGAGIVELQNLRELGSYVVSAAGDKEYTSVQSAINQAVIDGASVANQKTVYILPGVYVENLTFADGVNLVGFQADGRTMGVVIDGTATHPGGQVAVDRIAFSSANPITLALPANLGNAFLSMNLCSVDSGAGNIAISSNAITNASLYLQNTNVNGGAIGIELVANAQVVSENCSIVGTSAIDVSGTCSAFVSNGTQQFASVSGSVDINDAAFVGLANAIVDGPVLVNDTAIFASFRSTINSGLAVAVSIAVGATATTSSNAITCNNGGGDWAAGTGNIFTDGQNSLLGSAITIAGALTTTVIPTG